MTRRPALLLLALAALAVGAWLWADQRPAEAAKAQVEVGLPHAVDAGEPEPADAGAPPEAAPLPIETRWFGFCDLAEVPVRMPAAEANRRRALMAALQDSWPTLSRRPTERVVAELEAQRDGGNDPDLATLQEARLLSETTDLARARAVLADYMRRFPDDRPNGQLAARLDTQLEIQSGYGLRSGRGVTVWFDREALTDARADQLAEDVRKAIDEAAALTRTAARDRVTVVVYPTRSELLATSCVPDWSGGVFDGTLRFVPRDGKVLTRMVRHESMHAQIEPLMATAPTWFSEGLAEYFEHPDAKYDATVGAAVSKSGGVVPFAKVSAAFHGQDLKLAVRAYTQSDAMVRWILSVRGALAPADAVAYFARAQDARAVLTALEPSGTLSEEAFGTWLESQHPPTGN